MTCLSKEWLSNYLNPILIETGTFLGEGVQIAKDSGFDKVISIEASEILFQKARVRFKFDITIEIIHGDSSKVLWEVIENIKEKITFVLDAHNLCYGEDTRINSKGLEWWPLVKELQIIAQHERKDHTIIVDDVRLFSLFGTSIAQIKSMLLEINPNYLICFKDGFNNEGECLKDNILIAESEER